MRIKLFVKEDCPRCPAAKQALGEMEGLEVYDVGDVEGLTEAAFHSVLATPSCVIVDADGNELASWRGEVPDRDAVRRLVLH
ncbi:MAG: thioredoxin family protein [Coriobacteriia bacterium]|nr:thioredoxin family protein [Coriobacteriia bacterium]